MDKISEILKNIKERLSNPFIFSFAVSWMFCNWYIIIPLLWYDPKQIEQEGYKSIISYLHEKIQNENNLIVPLKIALVYTLGVPLLKIFINLYNSGVLKLDDLINLKLIKSTRIPVDKYLALRKTLKTQHEELSKIIESESYFIDENTKLKSLNDEAKKILIDRNDIVENLSNVQILKGYWKVSYKGFKSETIILEFDGLRIYSFRKNEERVEVGVIKNFLFNKRDKEDIKVFFVRDSTNHAANNDLETGFSTNGDYYINDLTFINSDYLKGKENMNIVEYYRTKAPIL